MSDAVNHPPHYTAHPSGVECITVTEHMNFCLGNAVKYIWRADLKADALEDLEKARWYLAREIRRRRRTAGLSAEDEIDGLRAKLAEMERRAKEYDKSLSRRVDVENILLSIAAGKRDILTIPEYRELALKLGVPPADNSK